MVHCDQQHVLICGQNHQPGANQRPGLQIKLLFGFNGFYSIQLNLRIVAVPQIVEAPGYPLPAWLDGPIRYRHYPFLRR